MKNFIQPGKVIDAIAPSGGVVSGLVYVLGSLIGVAAVTVAQGEAFTMDTEGVFLLPKTSAQAWTVGAKIYWDGTNKVATTTSSGNTLIGIAVEAAVNPSGFGKVKLGPTTV